MMCGLAFHPERTFTLGAANGSCEPFLPIFCGAAKVRCREIGKLAEEVSIDRCHWENF